MLEKAKPEIEEQQERLNDAFADFRSRNGYSSVSVFERDKAVEDPEETAGFILKPWGDPSLAFLVPHDPAELAGALNMLVLPERLSAIWHRDNGDLEVIWTARKLIGIWQPVMGRKFTFTFRGKEHECEFRTSSDRLITLAKHVQPLSTSTTMFRNMQSFATYVDEGADKTPFDSPKSFFISNVEWHPETTIEMLQHLNFYLTYYDNQSPSVLIHDISADAMELAQRTRYIASEFPTEIQAADIDQNLLTFWGAAQLTNQVMQFIIYYRMIEYCSMQYVDHTVRSELQRIVSAPDIRRDVPAVVDAVITAISKKSLDDPAKLKAVIRNNVDPKHIWLDVKENLPFFSEEQEFDGGFKVRALVGATEAEEGFCKRGLDSFSDALRRIRNALSHGKDEETHGVILPTQRNMELLRPWVHLIATAAGDVALYKAVT